MNFFRKQVAEGVRLRGAAKIIGVDLNPAKFEIGLTDFLMKFYYELVKLT